MQSREKPELFFAFSGSFFKVFAEPRINLRVEIRHNSGETGAAHFQRFEQARGVGVEYLESHAVNGSELFVYHAGVAAGIFEKSESAGLGELFEHLGSHNALIGIGHS